MTTSATEADSRTSPSGPVIEIHLAKSACRLGHSARSSGYGTLSFLCSKSSHRIHVRSVPVPIE